MSLSLKPTLKRKSIDMKEKIKIIKEYDAKMAKEGKVNKVQFAAKLGIPRSSLATIVGEKTRQSMETADNEGKAIMGRKRMKTKRKIC